MHASYLEYNSEDIIEMHLTIIIALLLFLAFWEIIFTAIENNRISKTWLTLATQSLFNVDAVYKVLYSITNVILLFYASASMKIESMLKVT